VRLRFLLLAVLAAGLAAASAQANARPVTPQDKALLARVATSEERVAEAVAARLTGHKSSVRCGPLGYADSRILGVTPLLDQRSFDYFLMRPEQCSYLAWFRQAPWRWDPRSCAAEDCAYVSKIAMALAVVSHESYHVLGYSDEAQVECYGMQSIWFVANKLGASVAESQALASLYATRMYPTRQLSTPRYWSAECRDGGKFDLRPKLRRWPS
jgi:hypothetical protein